jgi:protein-S-isoprenylcysteine O-methyltransferase Ste14
MKDKTKGNLMVTGQFILLAELMFVPGRSDWAVGGALHLVAQVVLGAGIFVTAVAIVGLGRSLTANPVPLERATLKTTGLYAVVRHPIYLGLILIGVGLTVGSGSVFQVPALLGLVALLHFKARFEERLLFAKYPDYAEYASKVGRLVPGVGRIR